jgi:WXG100 family type VII secretion target
MADNQGGVKHLYTKDMKETSIEFQRNIDDFQDAVEKVSKATTKLLSTWAGKSRDRFETQYNLLFGQLKDFEGALYDIYDALVDSETAYIDADEALKKEFNIANK